MLKNPNILEHHFKRRPDIPWHICPDGLIELTLEHKGFFAIIAHKAFHRPRQSQIKLDELGSFVWQALDEYDSIPAMAQPVQAKFGERAEPLLPRLAKFFQILRDNNLIELKPASTSK